MREDQRQEQLRKIFVNQMARKVQYMLRRFVYRKRVAREEFKRRLYELQMRIAKRKLRKLIKVFQYKKRKIRHNLLLEQVKRLKEIEPSSFVIQKYLRRKIGQKAKEKQNLIMKQEKTLLCRTFVKLPPSKYASLLDAEYFVLQAHEIKKTKTVSITLRSLPSARIYPDANTATAGADPQQNIRVQFYVQKNSRTFQAGGWVGSREKEKGK